MVAQGQKPSPRDLQAWPRFVEGKLSVANRLLVQAGEAMGLPVSGLRGEPYEQPTTVLGPDRILETAGNYTPIGPSQAIQGIRQDFPAAALEIAGGRTTPISPWARLNELVPGWDKLVDWQRKEEAAKNPEVREWWDKQLQQGLGTGKQWAETKQEVQQADAEAETQLLALYHNPQATHADVSDAYSNYLQKRAQQNEVRYADMPEGDPRSDLERRSDAYYAAGPTEFMTAVDRNAAFDAQDAILEADPELKDGIRSGRILRWPSAEMQALATEIENAKDVRGEYYAIPAKRGISLEEQKSLSAELAQVYAYMHQGMKRLQAIRQVTDDHDLRMRLLRYLKRRSNPERKAFRESYLSELQWFEALPFEEMYEEEEPELIGAR